MVEKKDGNQDGVQTKRNKKMRYGKPIKNTKRRDPRYFLNENLNEEFGGTVSDRIANDQEKEGLASLKPKQYTFVGVYDMEHPTLVFKDENGMGHISRVGGGRFQDAGAGNKDKNERLILDKLKPNGYTSVGVIPANLREGEE